MCYFWKKKHLERNGGKQDRKPFVPHAAMLLWPAVSRDTRTRHSP